MRIIYFKENEKEIWNKFVAENCSESFLQSWEWGEFQKSLGRKIWRIGIVDGNFSDKGEMSKPRIPRLKSRINSKSQILNKLQITNLSSRSIGDYKLQTTNNPQLQITNYKLLSIALIVKHNLPFGRSYLYCPRGVVIKKFKVQSMPSRCIGGSKFKVLDFLFKEVKKIAEKEKSLFLRIDPPVELNDEFEIMNYEYSPNFKKSPNEIQPRDTLILDLTKSEEEILKEMKQKTRYNIKLAGKKKLEIRDWEIGRLGDWESFKKDFNKFWELIEETSARDKFVSHNKDYYWKMLEGLGEAQKAPQPYGTMEPANKGDISECRLRARLYLAKYENKIIAANIVLYFGDLAIYLHGASSGEYRNLMAPHLLQWRQILDAKNAGCEKYDFWGVSASCRFENEGEQAFIRLHSQNTWQGITRFKKGFGGEEKNYIGAYDAVFDNIGYAVYKFVKSIKSIKFIKFIKSVKSKVK